MDPTVSPVQCLKGYASAGGVVTSCTACGSGYYSLTNGSSSCTACPSGSAW
jgi:hypothetical protein